jgi:hypothetical protein
MPPQNQPKNKVTGTSEDKMQIGSISSIAPITSAPAAFRASNSAASTTSSTDSDAPTPAKTSSTVLSSAHSAPSASAATKNNPLAAAYSTSVGGKTYSGSVSEAGGVYEVAVPNVLGAHASGSSIQAAENNLNMRIDELV